MILPWISSAARIRASWRRSCEFLPLSTETKTVNPLKSGKKKDDIRSNPLELFNGRRAGSRQSPKSDLEPEGAIMEGLLKMEGRLSFRWRRARPSNLRWYLHFTAEDRRLALFQTIDGPRVAFADGRRLFVRAQATSKLKSDFHDSDFDSRCPRRCRTGSSFDGKFAIFLSIRPKKKMLSWGLSWWLTTSLNQRFALKRNSQFWKGPTSMDRKLPIPRINKPRYPAQPTLRCFGFF